MILVSGGAGYIGSHTCVELIEAGYDDRRGGQPHKFQRGGRARACEKITGKEVPFVKCRALRPGGGRGTLRATTRTSTPVIHFAGLKAVGESVAKPLEYYTNNLVNTLMILNVMRRPRREATSCSPPPPPSYGDPGDRAHTARTCPTGGTTNPYGTTKLFIERILIGLLQGRAGA